MKPPFHGAEKPWHQDTAYFDYTPLGGVIGVWIALDEATVENGCMQVIPGSHLDGPAKHYHVRDCQLEDGGVRVDRAVVVPLKPGGALFFSGLIHHGTPPNTSGDRRRALLRLTDEGRAAFVASAPNGKVISRETLAPLDAKERAAFLRLLAKLV